MVLPAKVFEIKEKVDPAVMLWKLKDFREEESCVTERGENVSLVTEVLDLKSKEGLMEGILSRDYMRRRFYRRSLVEAPVTEEAPFRIMSSGRRTFLVVLAPSVARGVKKLLTNYVANKLSKVLFINSQAILEARMPHDTLRTLHESNPQATKLIWFDEVDIPGVEKLCLAGSDLVDTKQYHEYLEHGKIWYVVFEVQKRGIMVGITRNCVVTLFSKSSPDEFMDYVSEDFLKLVE